MLSAENHFKYKDTYESKWVEPSTNHKTKQEQLYQYQSEQISKQGNLSKIKILS
jgi:hypothetical protein